MVYFKYPVFKDFPPDYEIVMPLPTRGAWIETSSQLRTQQSHEKMMDL